MKGVLSIVVLLLLRDVWLRVRLLRRWSRWVKDSEDLISEVEPKDSLYQKPEVISWPAR